MHRDASGLVRNIRLLLLSSYRLKPDRHGTERRSIDCSVCDRKRSHPMGRGILLWLLGVPIPVLIVIWLLWH